MPGPARKRILVTGAAGFLGRHLCRRLVRDGFAGRVIALDARKPGSVEGRVDLGAGVTLVTGDVGDLTTVTRCLDGVDLVFHLAGIANPRACESDPAMAHAVNVGGTATLVRAATGRRLVLLSSAVIYLPAAGPVDESAPISEASTYAATKLAAERVCLEAMAAGHLEAIVVRNFNTYGDGQAPAFLVPQIVRQGVEEGHIQIASCRPVRDFMHVDDAIAALVGLGLGRIPGGVFNLGSGRGIAVGDLALTVGALLGVAVSCGHEAVAGAAHLVAANAKIATALGWTPTVDLAEGLTRTIEWFRARKGTAD